MKWKDLKKLSDEEKKEMRRKVARDTIKNLTLERKQKKDDDVE